MKAGKGNKKAKEATVLASRAGRQQKQAEADVEDNAEAGDDANAEGGDEEENAAMTDENGEEIQGGEDEEIPTGENGPVDGEAPGEDNDGDVEINGDEQ